MASVWIYGDTVAPLVEALRRRGITVRVEPLTPDPGGSAAGANASLAAAALALYDGGGVVVVDARAAMGRAALDAHEVALVPVLAIAPAEAALPAGVLRLAPRPVEQMAHHVGDVIRAPSELRRHPRVPARLPLTLRARSGEALVDTHTADLSLYGLRAVTDDPRVDGEVSASVTLSDGARVQLVGHVVDRREGHLALRCRPATDDDLVLWLHVLIAELERSPLHRDLDPFGPLFA